MNIEPKKKTMLKVSKPSKKADVSIEMTDKMKGDVIKGIQKRKSKEVAKKFFSNIKNK